MPNVTTPPAGGGGIDLSGLSPVEVNASVSSFSNATNTVEAISGSGFIWGEVGYGVDETTTDNSFSAFAQVDIDGETVLSNGSVGIRTFSGLFKFNSSVVLRAEGAETSQLTSRSISRIKGIAYV